MTMQVDKARPDELDGYRESRGAQWCAIFDALREYRLSNMTFEGTDEPFCLVDLVSNIGGDTSTGEMQLLELADEISLAIGADRSLRSTEGKEAEPYAYEYGKSNGDGTYCVVIERGARGYADRFAVSDWPIKPLYATPEAAEAHVAKLREALTPSGNTKAAYMGEFSERIEIANPMYEGNEDDEPETIMQNIPVSWTTIKEIMDAISARAALTRSPE